jgi:uncharacterized ParB-like nuclease family protein
MESTSRALQSNTQDITSIHAGLIEEVHDVPMGVLIRPFPLEVNNDKVHSIMETLQVSSSLRVQLHSAWCELCQNLHAFI